jgi:hypothetical protein
MDTQSDDQALAQLRADYPGWRIWRSVRSDGRLGEWVATLHDPRAGVTPTVMWPSAEQLRAALIEERRLVETR